MRILVSPDELRSLAVRLKQATLSLEDIYMQVRRSWASLDLDVKEQSDLEMVVIQAQRLAQILAEQADRLGRTLNERALAFEHADLEGASGLMRTTREWHATYQAIRLQMGRQDSSFPSVRSQRYLQLGSLISAPFTNSGFALYPVRVEPREMQALVKFSVDEFIGRLEHLGLLKDRLDVVGISAWHTSVNQAFDTWSTAVVQHGANSPMARTVYGNYLEVLIFKMPFFDTKGEVLLSIMKILDRVNPVE